VADPNPFDPLLRRVAELVVDEIDRRGPRRLLDEELVRVADTPAPKSVRRELPTYRLGRELFVKRVDLAEWIERHKVAPAAAPRPGARPSSSQDPIARALASGKLRRIGGGAG
jgi:hypothetical protein